MRNVLIIGAANRFRSTLRERLQREGYRVYILSPEKEFPLQDKTKVYVHPYIHPSNREVYLSCRPEIVIFLGAYDSHYDWISGDTQKMARDYGSDLNNLLFQANEAGVRQFVYLSSEDVFNGSSLSPLPEEALPKPGTHKGNAVLLGETMMAHYAKYTSMDAVVLRLDGVSYEAEEPAQCASILTSMVRAALVTGEIPMDAKLTHSLLYAKDAVRAIYRFLSAPTHRKQLYHISSRECFSEETLAELILRSAPQNLQVRDCTLGVSRMQTLYGAAFEDEFQFSARARLEEYGPELVSFMTRGGRFVCDKALREEQKSSSYRSFFQKVYPFLESTACFLLVLLLELLTQKYPMFEKVDFFLLFVFVFSVIHGFFQSVYTSVLSVFGFFLLSLYQGGTLSSVMDAKSYLWIAQLFILGMSVGTLRDKLSQNKEKWEDERAYLKDQLKDIITINESNVELKDYFEQQDINNRESLNYFYSIVRRLDESPEDEMMFVSVQVLVETMHTRDAAIYSMTDNGFCRLKTATSSRAMSLGKSVRQSNYEELFRPLMEGKVFVNRTLDKFFPSMAVSIKDEEGMQYVILLWDMPYEQMTQHTVNTLRLLSLIIDNYISRTVRYLTAISHDRYYEGTNILREEAFRSMFATYYKASRHNLSTVSLLRIDGMPENMQEASEQLDQLFRQDDILGAIDGKIYVLLTNTDRAEAVTVIERLASRDIQAHYLLEPPAPDIG